MSEGDRDSNTFLGGLKQVARHGGVSALLGAAFVFAVVGGVSLNRQQSEHAEQYNRATGEEPEDPPQQIQAECVQVPRTSRTTCIIDAPIPQPDERTATADLKAQQEMADWALAMFFATGVGVLVTFAGVIYVAMTLHETRRMSAEAAKATAASETAAAAAVAANTGFVESSKRELRAYVHVAKAEILDVKAGSYPQHLLQIQNAGQTPAYNLQVAIIAAIAVTRPPFDRSKADISSPTVLGPGLIQTQSEKMIQSLNETQASDIKAGVRELYVFGEITYRDAFDTDRITRFSYRHDATGIGRGSRDMIATEHDNDAT